MGASASPCWKHLVLLSQLCSLAPGHPPHWPFSFTPSACLHLSRLPSALLEWAGADAGILTNPPARVPFLPNNVAPCYAQPDTCYYGNKTSLTLLSFSGLLQQMTTHIDAYHSRAICCCCCLNAVPKARNLKPRCKQDSADSKGSWKFSFLVTSSPLWLPGTCCLQWLLDAFQPLPIFTLLMSPLCASGSRVPSLIESLYWLGLPLI